MRPSPPESFESRSSQRVLQHRVSCRASVRVVYFAMMNSCACGHSLCVCVRGAIFPLSLRWRFGTAAKGIGFLLLVTLSFAL